MQELLWSTEKMKRFIEVVWINVRAALIISYLGFHRAYKFASVGLKAKIRLKAHR